MDRRSWAPLALALAAGCYGSVPDVDPAAAAALLAETPAPVVLDVRDAAEFEARHLPGAKRLAFDEVDGYLSRLELSPRHPLLVVCTRGSTSQIAGEVARRRGFTRVYNLAGGMRAWTGGVEAGPGVPVPPEQRAPIRAPATLFEQVMTVVVGIGVKATYMVLSLIAAALLWRSRERGLVLVRQGMLAFFFGEGMCAANFIFAAGGNDSIELLHGLGMIGMGMLVPWGLALLVDDRVLRYEDPAAACAVQRFCGRCWKRDPVPCGLQRLFLFLAPMVAGCALLPLGAPILPLKLEFQIFDSVVLNQVSTELQIAEFRVYPLLACTLLVVAFLLLLGGRRTFRWSQPFFFAGVGFASFTLLRFFLFHSFRDRILWADAWEEVTEFMAIALVLWGSWVFRQQLDLFRFLRPAPKA